MAEVGFVEVVTPEFVCGWATTVRESRPLVLAFFDDELIGWSQAVHRRADLPQGASFAVVFDRPVPEESMDRIEVVLASSRQRLPRLAVLRVEHGRKLQVFVLGSPRSGTSQLARCLQEVCDLPWFGEGHVAPIYASLLDALDHTEHFETDFMPAVEEQGLDRLVVAKLREAYFVAHASRSFLDKTPGTPMIRATRALARAFPEAKLIFMARNGVSNVLSRMRKFGGDFEEHCSDWAGAMEAWAEVKPALPSYIEVAQEEMMDDPRATAASVCEYLGVPDKTEDLHNALTTRSEERTGAGLGKSRLSSTGWDEGQARTFVEICGPMMKRYNYDLGL